jgi:hypothetical protein
MNQNEALYALLGTIFGFLSAFAVFRARFVSVEKDVESIKQDVKRIERVCGENPQRDRREREMIVLLASIAKRIGAQNRLTDIGHHIEDTAPE